MAAKAPLVSIRFKLSAAFAALSLVIAGVVISAFSMQLDAIDRAALQEAEDFAHIVAYTGPGNSLNRPETLQSYVEGLHTLRGRDLVFVDLQKKGIADADRRTIGAVYDQDPNNEVAQTIRDGLVRTFVERNGPNHHEVKQIVIPLRTNQVDSHSAIVGAAIVEYTQIYDKLRAAEERDLFMLAASGIACVLSSILFGHLIATRTAGRIKSLQDGIDIIAEGQYETKVPITSRDELGGLGRSFNVMAEALKSSRDLLEERVASRTKDLTRVNQQLRIEARERAKATTALTESDAGLRRAQSMARIAHVITGPDGSFESWADALPALIGIDPARMPQSTREWLDILHPDDRSIFRKKAIEAGSKGSRTEVEYRLQREDRAWIYIRQVMEPLQSQSNAPGKARWFNTLQDVTEEKKTDDALQRFRAAMDISGDAIFLVERASLRYVDVNQTFCDMFGYTRQEVLGATPMMLFGVGREVLDRDYDAVIASGDSGESRIHYQQRKDGLLLPLETRRRAMRTDAGWIIVGTACDITERKKAETKIIRLNRVYAVLSGINVAIARIRDRTELFQEVCRIANEVGQFGSVWIGVVNRDQMLVQPIAWRGSEAAVKHLHAAQFSLREDIPAGQSIVADAVRTMNVVISNDVQSDPRIQQKDGLAALDIRSVTMLPLLVGNEAAGVLALHSSEAGFFDEEEMKLLLELAGDIAFALDHIDKQERLEYLAYYDALTGLANRTLFLERVAQYIRSAVSGGHKLAVFFLDLERFRNINDSLGRPAGDALLKQVAEWLTRDAGDANLVARVGADHFAVVLPEVKPEHGARSLEKSMTDFLEHPFRLNDTVFRIAVKIGVATFPEDGADADTLVRNAEVALKKAKTGGDRYLFYTQGMNERVAEKLSLENQLRQALEKSEFVLHYQPKVNLESGKLTSAEALIRWNDPRTGLVPPGRFIPILEETGLIYDVGRWALCKAIEDYLRWRAAGLPAVRIAVNVSPLQLRNRDFITEIREAVNVDTLAVEGLELEITESLIMEDVKHSIASLQAVRAMGITIAIDDFGTGFSSLSYLAKLPVDTLKIDRSFVIDMTSGPAGLALVSTIIALAHSLKLKVVAEGVETAEQQHLLRLLSCDEMQGFLFSKPVPREIFETKFLIPVSRQVLLPVV